MARASRNSGRRGLPPRARAELTRWPIDRVAARLPAQIRRWLTPGIGIKRWLVVVFVGELGLAFGLAFVLRQVFRDVEPGEPIQASVSAS